MHNLNITYKKSRILPLYPCHLKRKKHKTQYTKRKENIPHSKTNLKISTNIETMNTRLNEPFIELMEKLADIMMKHGEPFRARAYQKAQETIMAYSGDISSPHDLQGKPGIGATIMEKLNEYVKTGTLQVLEREKTNPVNILADVYGIGPKKAQELVNNGITTIDKLRQNQQMLNDVQKIGLKYYEDILKRIPRTEIQEFENIFHHDFKKVTADQATHQSTFEIVGSYRRGAASSGDIDVIITSSNSNTFINFIDTLVNQNIILEILSRGPSKCLVIAKIPSSKYARRVDFLYTSHQEFPFAVLYFTGSKIFNTVMRHQAQTMGLTMNEHGLYTLQADGKKKDKKVDFLFHSEKDIFDYLHMEYKKPEERMDGRAVIITKKHILPQAVVIESDGKNNSVKTPIHKNKNILKIADEFKKNGLPTLEKLNEDQLSLLLQQANISYYNEEPFLTDNEFDIIKEYVANQYPKNNAVMQIGAPVTKNKVSLPYFMGSMDKIKPDTNALETWKTKFKGPYVISCKLDGVSGLYTTEGENPQLFTRGDGKVGQNISHIIPYLQLPKTKGIVIRGEFIIPKLVFDTKYKSTFANPRNMVAGIINHKTVHECIKDIHFVAYEVIKPVMKPSKQMEFIQTLDVDKVLCKIEPTLCNMSLSQTLVDVRQKYMYEIDGVIVTDDKIYEKKEGNPQHSFAFKMVLSDQVAEAKVVDVIWTPSKDGYLKPRVQIEPINLGGVRIEYATGFNGSFIYDNKVGVGAIIELIRSGDVIPHIRKVIVNAEHPKMPSLPYTWNESHVDVMLQEIDSDETVREKVITGFFRGIGVEGLSSGNVSRIIQAGFNTVPKIMHMTVADFLTINGFKEKTATKLYNGIKDSIDKASLVTIMSASNIFGRGFSEKKLELIMESYPNVLLSKETTAQKIGKVSSIKGMAEKTAEAFVEKIPSFLQFIKELHLVKKVTENESTVKIDTSHILFEKTVVLTGFRDDVLQQKIKELGGKLGTSVSKNTFVVLVKDINEDTGKAMDAKKLGIPIMDVAVFKEKYV
jgi:NAD-dependent DNA ligase